MCTQKEHSVFWLTSHLRASTVSSDGVHLLHEAESCEPTQVRGSQVFFCLLSFFFLSCEVTKMTRVSPVVLSQERRNVGGSSYFMSEV